MMGKEAANLLIAKGAPLHDSIVKMASSLGELNGEQVRRMVEFANTSAYLALHDKAKQAGAGHSYPQFDLADPDQVLAELGAPGQEQEAPVDPAYLQAPAKQKLSTPALDAELEKLFLGENGERVKTAGLDFTHETGVSQIMTAKEDLSSLRYTLSSSAEKLDSLFKQAEADYYDTVKRHLLDGGSFADVARAAHEVTDTATIQETLVPFVARLFQEKVAQPEALYHQLRTLEKVAHREVDETHPLVTQFGAVVALRSEIDKVASALQDVDSQLAKVKGAIRQEFLGAR